MRRVYDSGLEVVGHGHSVGNDAFNRGRKAASWQVHHSWGIPEGGREREKD